MTAAAASGPEAVSQGAAGRSHEGFHDAGVRDRFPAPALDSHGELVRSGVRCTCGWPHLRLTDLATGQVVPVVSGCVNRCEYCAGQKAFEDLEMLMLDLLEGGAPTVLAVTTTRTATLDATTFRDAMRAVVAAVRGRFPAAEFVRLTEFTTGYGPLSGGLRRPHWNWLWKHVDADQVDELRELIATAWCRYVDAEPSLVYCEAIRSPAAALKYVVAHFAKESQRPPLGFRGQRFNASRGYFAGVTVTTMRARAREVRQVKRETWRAAHVFADAYDVELAVATAMRHRAAARWVLSGPRGSRLSESRPAPEGVVARFRRRAAAARTNGERDGPRGPRPGANGRQSAAPAAPPCPTPRRSPPGSGSVSIAGTYSHRP